MNHRPRRNKTKATKIKKLRSYRTRILPERVNKGAGWTLLAGKAPSTPGSRREEGQTGVAGRISESAVTYEGAATPDKGGTGVAGGDAGRSWTGPE
jgi:hypothetical protein